MIPHGETPAAEHVPPEWHEKIMHSVLIIDDRELMGSDAPPGMYETPAGLSVALQFTDPVPPLWVR